MADHALHVSILACGFMTGLIWFVQVVHYPLMGLVGRASRTVYAAAHQARTTRVVAPVMFIEAAAAAWLSLSVRGSSDATLVWLANALLGVAWASTFLIQVPIHRRLLAGLDPRLHKRLVLTNWVRTAAWSVRLVLLTALLEGQVD